MQSVLSYHKITSRVDFGICTRTPKDFRKDVEFIAALPSEKRPIVSFDDGYTDTYEAAFPILSEYGLTGQVFVITDAIGKPNSWDANFFGEFQHIELSQVRELAQAGWEIGSHTKTHRALTVLSLSALREELETSKWFLEDAIGQPVTSISFPFGKFNEQVLQVCREVGYERAISISRRSQDGFVERSLAVYRFDRRAHLKAKLNKNKLELWRLQTINAFSTLTVLMHHINSFNRG
ncbi:polysaccharide deacetylase family protein [Chloroherpeton thalassium]|nr:polysaccharide deacetylase family protein [Chloroherpeton thalassium]